MDTRASPPDHSYTKLKFLSKQLVHWYKSQIPALEFAGQGASLNWWAPRSVKDPVSNTKERVTKHLPESVPHTQAHTCNTQSILITCGLIQEFTTFKRTEKICININLVQRYHIIKNLYRKANLYFIFKIITN